MSAINDFLSTVDNLVWGVPLMVLILAGGLLLTVRLRLLQVRKLPLALKWMIKNEEEAEGARGEISSFAALCTALSATIGTGNIVGVATAVGAGGPGALFWMIAAAFFGMATAYTESTLSQIFKEKKDDEYIGGLSFYGKKLLKGSVAAGVVLSLMYIIYALLCFPAQGFNTVSSVGQIAEVLTGKTIDTNSALYWIAFVVLIVVVIAVTFGGIKKVTKVTDFLVPIMAVIYVATVLVLIVVNFTRIPWFFYAVFSEAFKPEAVFGGAFGIALAQGVKRGLMSNEAGQGTITMPAAASNADHPCEQGCVQAVGVFLDTMVICTLTGFVVIMGRMWQGDNSAAWFDMGKLPKFLASATELAPGTAFNTVVSLLISVCFGLFAFTCLLGFMSFAEICANRISRNKVFINVIRVLCLLVISFGVLTSIAGLDLGALWNLSDFANILIAYCNIPLLYIGFKYVKRATTHFEKKDGTPFTSEVVGIDVPVWDNKAKQKN